MLGARQRAASASVSSCCRASSARFSSASSRRRPHVAGRRSIGPIGAIDAGEDGLQAVIVLLRDRVELVVVAAGAVDRQAQRTSTCVVITMSSRSFERAISLSTVPSRSSTWPTKSHGPAAMKPVAIVACGSSGNSTSPASCSSIRNGEYGLSALKRIDHVIAIRPGIRARLVLVVAVRLAVVHDVEPVPAPAFAVARRGQQPVDQLLVGVRGDASPAKASTSSGVGGRPCRSNVSRRISVRRSASAEGARSLSSELQDEGVDRRPRPSGIFHLRNRRTFERRQRPPGLG